MINRQEENLIKKIDFKQELLDSLDNDESNHNNYNNNNNSGGPLSGKKLLYDLDESQEGIHINISHLLEDNLSPNGGLKFPFDREELSNEKPKNGMSKLNVYANNKRTNTSTSQ